MKYKDILNYIILVAGFVVAGVAIYINRYNAAAQFGVVVFLSLFYLIWGLFHHIHKKDFSKGLLLEYLLISAIALVMGFFLFLR